MIETFNLRSAAMTPHHPLPTRFHPRSPARRRALSWTRIRDALRFKKRDARREKGACC